MYQKEPSFGERAVRGVEQAGRLYAAGKTVLELGRGLYSVGRVIAPLIL